jgi:serine/threonine protein kinase
MSLATGDRLGPYEIVGPIRERFDREAKAISHLDHPHICTLHDVGERNGTSYLVMQYLDGETLADRLGAGPLPLDEAHRAGVVHHRRAELGRRAEADRRCEVAAATTRPEEG